jgi:hypothetical protein
VTPEEYAVRYVYQVPMAAVMNVVASEMVHCVVLQRFTDILEGTAACSFRVEG